MKCRGWVVLMTLCCLAAPVAAEEKPDAPSRSKDFATVKQQVLQRIDQRLLRLHQEQDCVKAATTHKGLNGCRPKKRGQRHQTPPAATPLPPAPPAPSAPLPTAP